MLLHRDPSLPVPDRLDIDRLYQYASVLRRQGADWSLTVKGAPAGGTPVEPAKAVSDAAQAALMGLVVKAAESGALPLFPDLDRIPPGQWLGRLAATAAALRSHEAQCKPLPARANELRDALRDAR